MTLSQSSSDHVDATALASCSTLIAFDHGTGASLYKNLLLPAILNARHEIILTTCFWATSETLQELVSTLRELSTRVTSAKHPERPVIKVYLCFSSQSATQKLFHTTSEDGYTYPANEWSEKLGLPPPNEVPGLDITVKSLFFRPFSVLHSKYIIIDRQIVFFPSCNVSWEDWYECAVGLKGPIVKDTFDFWKDVWRPAGLIDLSLETTSSDLTYQHYPQAEHTKPSFENPVKSTLLPHPHNASLLQAIWFVPKLDVPLPKSPLNTTLLRLISHAESEVIILTPNFTSSAAFAAVCSALSGGVRVHLITDRRMMVPEQLATSGLTTEQCVDSLINEYKTGFHGRKLQTRLARLEEFIGRKPSSETAVPGKLKVSYFQQPLDVPPTSSTSLQTHLQDKGETNFDVAANATKSHIKLTLVDRRAIILGSGNMDRASWRTSQELGILLEDEDGVGDSTSTAEKLWLEVERGLKGCLEAYFDG